MQIEEIKIYESIDYLNLSNADGNETSYSGYQDLYSLRESMFETLARVQKYFIPSLCVLGFLGNVSSFGIFMIKSMKQKSCVNYLLFKCVTDAFFLTSLFVVWLDRVGVKWFNYHGVCQILVLVTYVSAFMSVWMVVMVTFENYVCICHPQLVTKFCTARRAQLVILLLLVLSTLCYHFPVWTSHVVLISNVSVCTEVG
ncbi:12-(S)-hydroxy-5 8 10 14-eicosatetraenoic acid receptor, partial [Biomphalaria glabrata]